MLSANIRDVNKVKVGDKVLLRVPDVDRGPLDPNNVICLILEEKNTLFKLGCKVGVLDKWYAFNAFFKTNAAWSFKDSDIPKVKDKKGEETQEMVVMSLREAVRKLSVGTVMVLFWKKQFILIKNLKYFKVCLLAFCKN